MSRTSRNWMWMLLAVWALVLITMAEADGQEATLTVAQQAKILALSDTAQASGRKYVKDQQAYVDGVKEISAADHFPEGTTYKVDFDPSKCVPLANGDMQCKRRIVPVFPKKSDVAPSSVEVPKPAEKKP